MHELDDITGAIIDAAIKIHQDLGPGLLESVYEALLARSLMKRGLTVQQQKWFSFEYDGVLFKKAFRIDLLVEEKVVVEVKSIERLAPVHGKQVLTYLRLTKLQVGLLMNFGSATLKEGLQRIVNRLDPSASPRLRVNSPDPTSGLAKEGEVSRGAAEIAERKADEPVVDMNCLVPETNDGTELMSIPLRPLNEVTHDAYQILVEKLGLAETLRFLGQFTTGKGDYTVEREARFGHMTLDQIVSDIEKRRDTPTEGA